MSERLPHQVSQLSAKQQELLRLRLQQLKRRTDLAATFHDLFRAQARRYPDRVALVFGERQVSYGVLDQLSDRLAHRLQANGVGPETLVGLCVPRSPEMIIGLLAILKAGGAYVPLDPGYPRERLAYMITDARLPVLLTRAGLRATLPAGEATVLDVDTLWPELVDCPATVPVAGTTVDNLAYVIYTSGSTGQPKGVQVTHRGIRPLVDCQRESYGLDTPQRVLQGTTLSFDISVWEISTALLSGSTLVLPAPDLRMIGSDLADLLVEQAVENIGLTPSALATLPASALPALRSVSVGGEACPLDLVRTWAPGRGFFNGYGPTETTICASLARYPADLERIHIGRPVPGTTMYVLDSRLNLLPIGVAGELYIGGSGLARGYLGRPDLTAELFIPDPFGQHKGGRLYRTGDRARMLPDGTIEFLGRVDAQVKIRGYRVELGEIEAALADHPGTRAAAVLLHEDAGTKRLVAYLVSGEPPDPEELRQHLAQRLPAYMVPSAFVPLPQLPLNANGKLDRQALAAIPWEQHAVTAEREFVAPRTPVEEQLAKIWQAVLGVTQPVGIHDNFLALGGDSILSLQVIFRAKQLGLHFTVKQLFEYPTLAQLSAAVVEQHAPRVQTEQGLVTGPVDLTPIQRWFFAERFANPAHWNQSLLLRVPAALTAQQWERALLRLLEQHDGLRARFQRDGDTWRAELADVPPEFPVEVHELSSWPPVDRDSQVERIAQQAQAGLDLAEPPLLRAVLFTGLDDDHRLLLVAHHLVVDVVSWRILLEDLATMTDQLQQGRDLVLPAKSSSWQLWAARLRQEATSPATSAELPYWLEQTAATARPLPVDDVDADSATTDDGYEVRLDRQETHALLHDIPAAFDTRINDVLLTAVAAALGDWTGDTHVRVDLEGHGREDLFDDVDVSRTVGWFTTISPLRLPVPPADDPGVGLKEIKQLLRRRPRQGIGYGLLRTAAPDQPGAGLDPAGTAQVSFNYLGQFDQSLAGRFRAEFGKAGPDVSPANHRPYLIDIVSSIEDGELRMRWAYGAETHTRDTVARVAARAIDALRALIAEARRPDLLGYSPCDMPLSDLTQPQVDSLIGQLRQLPAWQESDHPRPLEDCYPQTPVQQGLRFQSQFAQGQGLYHLQMVLEIEQDLQVDAFRAAWARVMARQPILRTGFLETDDDVALQLVWRRLPVPLTVRDWRDQPAERQQQHLREYLHQDRTQGFDRHATPQWRMLLARTADDRHHLVWSAHHAIIDGWSTGLLLSEMVSAYDEVLHARVESTPPARPYRDYVAWLRGQDMGQAEQFWRAALADVEQAAPLSVERPSAVRADGAGLDGHEDAQTWSEQAWESVFLTDEEAAGLHTLAQAQHLTLNTVLQGCWALLLSRYSRTDDVVFGVVVSGRPPEVEGVDRTIGLFINTLPIRVRVPGQHRWLDWLRRLQEQNTQLRQYEFSPLGLVQQWSDIPANAPLFETLFVFENFPPDSGHAGTLRFRELSSAERTHYPLNLVVTLDERLGLRLLYDTQRFDAGTVRGMLGHLREICRSLLDSPHQKLAEVDLLTGPERARVLAEWSATETVDVDRVFLHELIAAQAERTPDAIAVVFEDQQLSYRELDTRANRLAHWLQARGVGPDVLVGLCVERSVEVLVGLLAILKAGGAYVPMDPHQPADRLAFLVQDARLHLLLTQSHLLAAMPTEQVPVFCLDTQWSTVADYPASAPVTALTPDNLAYIIYTSGSTGKPKGVMVAHRCVHHIVPWQHRNPHFNRAQRVLQVASYTFDFSVWEIIMPLLTGGTLCIPRHDVHMVGTDLAAMLHERAIENLNFTPAALATLPAEAFGHLRTLVVGGEAYPADLIRLWAPGRTFYNVYGPTETTVFATGTHTDEHLDVIHIGRPITNVRLYVLDPYLHPVPVGVPGELYIGGVGVTRGYLHRPDLTAELFVADPFGPEPGQRLYRSGDLVRYLPDGNIEFVGRVDHQVKIRGFRIELGEIEAVLSQHAEVHSAAVVVQPEGASQRLVAYVVPRAPGADLTESLRDHLGRQLPFYMIPAVFVYLDQLPLTANGKLNRRALPLPQESAVPALADSAKPRTATEATLAGIWEQVLGRSPVGVFDNFFAVGGHSLLAVQVIARIRQAFAVEMPVRVLFEQPTVAQVAGVIDQLRNDGHRSEAATAPLLPVGRDRPLPATFDQQRLWFMDRLNPGSAFYNVGWLLYWSGPLDSPTLRRGLLALADRHETLRTTFREERGQVWQVVAERGSVVLTEQDLSRLPAEQREAAAQRLVRQLWTEPFDLADGPLLRTLVIRLSDTEAALAFNAHHTIIDGYSIKLFNQELRQLYRAAAAEPDGDGVTATGLPALPVQYADYAVWQQQWLHTERLRTHLDYWKDQLADAPELITLPLDHPRPAVQSFRGATFGRGLPRELTQALHTVSREHQTTHFITALTAFAALLSHYSGQDRVVIGIPIANRSRIETEPLIGFLVNTVALCVDLRGNPTFAQLLQQVRNRLLEAQNHQEVPFERIVEELAPERSLAYSPVFQVMFTGLDKLFEELPDEQAEPDWMRAAVDDGVGVAKFDLGLRIQQQDGELQYSFEYSTDLFEPDTIARMSEHFQLLVAAALGEQQQPISTLMPLTAAERRRLVEDCNATRDDALLRPVTLHQLFAEQVARTPERIAVSDEHQQLSYAELDRRSNQLARVLRAHGVGPESRVGICAQRSVELEIGLLAILKAGGAYVPLDPGYPPDRLAYMVHDAGMQAVLVQHATRHLVQPLVGSEVPIVHLDPDLPGGYHEDAGPLEGQVHPDNLAYVIYTSGSTGRPKGAMLSHRGICNRLLWMQEAYQLREHDRVVQKTPFSFDVSVWEFFWPVIVGAHLHLARPDGHRDPAYLAELIDRERISILHFVPSMLQAFLEQQTPVDQRCRTVRHIVCSGEALPLEVQTRCLERLPAARLHNLYGPTEASVDVSFWECHPVAGATTVPIGRPVANTQLYILNQAMLPVPQGVVGELFIGGVQLARGYLGRADLTAERFVADPFGTGRLYATGDLARFGPDGSIEYVGRKDHQIKIRGHRIEVGEIEAVLAQHPAVDACLVVVHDVAPTDKRLAAYYTAGRSPVDTDQLRDHLRRHLPEYMIPTYLVPLEQFPLSPNGKVDRAALPSLADVLQQSRTGDDFAPPQTQTELELAEIWVKLLGVEQVGLHDDFFALGGHSLLVASLATEVQAVWDISLMLPVVFQNRTLQALAHAIDENVADADGGEMDADDLFNLP